MSGSWRQRMRETHGEQTDRYLRELGAEDRDDAAIAAERRLSQLEALREIDPGATLDEELELRLTGSEAERGALQFDWAPIMRPLQDGVSAAAHAAVGLELLGISRGSTVLHVRPVLRSAPPADGLGQAATSPVDDGVRKLVQLLGALEEERDVREWAALMEPIDTLSSLLDKFDLSLGLTWYAADGGVRQGALTEHGRRYATELRSTRPYDQEVVVSGRITELRSSGVVKAKSGFAPNSPAYEVKLDELVHVRSCVYATVS